MIATTSPVVIMSQEELAAMIAAAADAAVKKAMAMNPARSAIRPDSVTQADAARMLNKSRTTIGKMVKSGIFRLNKLGNIPMEQIDAALVANA